MIVKADGIGELLSVRREPYFRDEAKAREVLAVKAFTTRGTKRCQAEETGKDEPT